MKTSVYRVHFPDHKSYKTSLSVLRVSPDGAPKYVLQLVHGISEKKERYLPLMEFMASHGAEVILHDLPGHGSTPESMAQLGILRDPGVRLRISPAGHRRGICIPVLRGYLR